MIALAHISQDTVELLLCARLHASTVLATCRHAENAKER